MVEVESERGRGGETAGRQEAEGGVGVGRAFALLTLSARSDEADARPEDHPVRPWGSLRCWGAGGVRYEKERGAALMFMRDGCVYTI